MVFSLKIILVCGLYSTIFYYTSQPPNEPKQPRMNWLGGGEILAYSTIFFFFFVHIFVLLAEMTIVINFIDAIFGAKALHQCPDFGTLISFSIHRACVFQRHFEMSIYFFMNEMYTAQNAEIENNRTAHPLTSFFFSSHCLYGFSATLGGRQR